MTAHILDASVILAQVHGEAGMEAARAAIADDSAVSAVNLAEVVSKLLVGGASSEQLAAILHLLGLSVIPLTAEIAVEAGRIHAASRHLGLSLADAACIATARALGATAVTADRAWADLPDQVRIIR